MAIRHYLTFADFTLDQYSYLFERTKLIKRKFKNYETYHPLLDRTLVMVFEKNSTRTRLSFEAGMHLLRTPHRPRWTPTTLILLEAREPYEEWRPFLQAG